jgi:hypothetical protein
LLDIRFSGGVIPLAEWHLDEERGKALAKLVLMKGEV